MLRPWSPSPIAWSRAVSSSTWSISVCVALRMRSAWVVVIRSSLSARRSRGDAPAFGIEPEWTQQLDADRVARFETRSSGCGGDQLLVAVVQADMHEVLIAQSLDPPDAGTVVTGVARRPMQTQVFGAHADRDRPLGAGESGDE